MKRWVSIYHLMKMIAFVQVEQYLIEQKEKEMKEDIDEDDYESIMKEIEWQSQHPFSLNELYQKEQHMKKRMDASMIITLLQP